MHPMAQYFSEANHRNITNSFILARCHNIDSYKKLGLIQFLFYSEYEFFYTFYYIKKCYHYFTDLKRLFVEDESNLRPVDLYREAVRS